MKSTLLSRFFIVMALAVITLTATVSPVSASGVETWSDSAGPWEKIRVTNNNTTPVKTIGRAGTLWLNVLFANCKADGCSDTEPSYYPPVRVTGKIISYPSGEVLASESMDEGGLQMFNLVSYRPLSVGEKVRIFFDVSSVYNPPGPYRKAHINFQYEIK